MPNKPLQQRAGRNIGIESLAVFLQAAGVLPVDVVIDGPKTTLLQAVQNALRTPRMQSNSGYVFNDTGVQQLLKVYLQDQLNNSMLISSVVTPVGGGPLDLTSVFSPLMPLCLCDGEKLVVSAVTIPLLLDVLTQQPDWAHWIGGKLRSSYAGPMLKVRNDADVDLDIGATVFGLVNIAAISEHCGAGRGRVVAVYNQVAAPVPMSLSLVGPAGDAPYCYNNGPLLGANGYLAATNDGAGFSNVTGLQGAFSLVGDVAITMIGDIAPDTATLNPYFAAGPLNNGAGSSDWLIDVAFPDNGSAEFELNTENDAAFVIDLLTDGWPANAGWYLLARDAGQQLQDTTYEWKGLARSLHNGVNGTTVPVFAGTQLGWFAPNWGAQHAFAANQFVWKGLNISTPNKAACNAWESTHHS